MADVFDKEPSEYVDMNELFPVLNEKVGLSYEQWRKLVENVNYVKNNSTSKGVVDLSYSKIANQKVNGVNTDAWIKEQNTEQPIKIGEIKNDKFTGVEISEEDVRLSSGNIGNVISVNQSGALIRSKVEDLGLSTIGLQGSLWDINIYDKNNATVNKCSISKGKTDFYASESVNISTPQLRWNNKQVATLDDISSNGGGSGGGSKLYRHSLSMYLSIPDMTSAWMYGDIITETSEVFTEETLVDYLQTRGTEIRIPSVGVLALGSAMVLLNQFSALDGQLYFHGYNLIYNIVDGQLSIQTSSASQGFGTGVLQRDEVTEL